MLQKCEFDICMQLVYLKFLKIPYIYENSKPLYESILDKAK